MVESGTVPQKKTAVTSSESIACPTIVLVMVRAKRRRPPVQTFIFAST